MEVRKEDGSELCDGAARGIGVPIGVHNVHKHLKGNRRLSTTVSHLDIDFEIA
jgi:hypothetical protein